jgi:hypothetical protein
MLTKSIQSMFLLASLVLFSLSALSQQAPQVTAGTTLEDLIAVYGAENVQVETGADGQVVATVVDQSGIVASVYFSPAGTAVATSFSNQTSQAEPNFTILDATQFEASFPETYTAVADAPSTTISSTATLPVTTPTDAGDTGSAGDTTLAQVDAGTGTGSSGGSGGGGTASPSQP